ncbi:SDR family oxidoreductase [Nocardia sp. NPDC005978]|uniref:SDR family oxidoreductase n=1 Tax=unclassified Nocardia TaxID=2637762 RepID=UPI0033B03763
MTDPDRPLTDRTMVISGASRGIGLAIAVAAAAQGANVVLLAKTGEPHPKLSGTVHTAAAEIEAAGGKAAAVIGDVRSEEDVRRAVDTAVERFGGVDLCVNNASAIATEATDELSAKRFDLMQDVNIRGTFLLTRACLPHLRQSPNAHVLTLSPPINMNPRWLGAHPSYTVSKYGMTLLTLGWAAEFAGTGMAFNCLWPETFIATAAVAHMTDSENLLPRSRSPRIMGDAAVAIVTQPAPQITGHCFIDSDAVTRYTTTDDLSGYGGGDHPKLDLFLD